MIECHSPLSGLIIENLKVENKKMNSLMQCGPQAYSSVSKENQIPVLDFSSGLMV